MEQSGIRMLAYAVNIDEIRVFLSKDYYGGISSKFYLKDLIDKIEGTYKEKCSLKMIDFFRHSTQRRQIHRVVFPSKRIAK